MRAALIYIALFLVLLLWLPLHGLLPGNTDTLLAIALSNLSIEKLRLFFTGAAPYTAMFPARDVMAYGENCYGLVLVFEAMKLLTRNDLWSYYLFISTLLSMNAFGLYLVAGLFVERRLAFLAGAVFACLGFFLGNIDDPNVIFFFFPLVSLYFLESGCREANKRFVFLGLGAAGLQIWFGFYVFLFHVLTLSILSSARFVTLRKFLRWRDTGTAALAFLVPALPLLILYVWNHLTADVFSPYDARLTTTHASLQWHNFGNVLAGNLLHPESRNVWGEFDIGGWHRIRKCAFPGWSFIACAAIGVSWSFRRARIYGVIFLVFFTLSFGVHLPGFDLLLSLPLGPYFRVPLRFLLVAFVPACLFYSMGLERIVSLSISFLPKAALAPAIAVGVLTILENMPIPLGGFALAEKLAPPASYARFFSKFEKPQIVLDLPSTCVYAQGFHPDEYRPLWFYSRDIVYMNWQTYHHQIILGGVNGYVPRSRFDLDPEFQRLPDGGAITKLRAVGLKFVIFHKGMVLEPFERTLDRLKGAPALVQKFEDQDLVIFEVTG